MWTRLSFSQNSRLIGICQSNVAMAVTVNVHEHRSTHEKGVFMDSGVLALGHGGQTEDLSSQFLMEIW